MNETTGPKQKIVEKIKDSSNILVTVSKNPNVDELAAALGLTLMLDELEKHPTAVASGAMPAAIEFLDPEKTFENTVDSLRDFIIALDKEKADHLRYKVEGDVVKIFITPYRTTLSENDLEFTQGDYNVELVLALGVNSQDDLDEALSAHGKIFHDATVASLSVGSEKSGLGDMNWHEAGASSICEMLVSLSEALKSSKTLLTEQVATAYLTGIVAATDRFSNDLTSSKVMTMAAQLMAAGANQQLIAMQLQENDAISESDDSYTKADDSDGSNEQYSETESQNDTKTNAGTLSISHQKEGSLEEVAKQTIAERQAEATEEAEGALAEHLKTVAPMQAAGNIQDEIRQESVATQNNEPSLGGTLNATTEEAADAKRREEQNDRNKTILSHGQVGGTYKDPSDTPTFTAPLNAAMQNDAAEPPSVDIFAQGGHAPTVQPLGAPANNEISPQDVLPPAPSAAPVETLADLDRKNRADMHTDAQAAVSAAFENPQGAPSVEMPVATSGVAPLPPQAPAGMPPLPDFSNMPQPALPPLPQFGAPPSGGLPPEQLGQIFGSPALQPAQPTPPNQPPDPNQFQIPSQ